MYSKASLNDFHMHFGQMLAHDTDFATPYANFLTTDNLGIPIPEGDPWFDPHGSGKEIMRFRRSGILQTSGKLHGTPREQVMLATIDVLTPCEGSIMYESACGHCFKTFHMKTNFLLLENANMAAVKMLCYSEHS